MSLTNSQYEAIMRIYSATQTKNRHLQEERTSEVYAACPALRDIEDEIINLSVTSAQNLIQSGSSALGSYKTKLAQLTDRRDKLLTSSGFPADYLELTYDCPICHDTGFTEGHQCTCFKKKVVEMFYLHSNLKNIVASENFDTFSYDWYSNSDVDSATGLTPYENMHQVVSICKEFIQDFDNNLHNLLIYGDTGVGKTFLTNCIASELLATSHSVIYLTAIELFEIFSDNVYDKSSRSAATAGLSAEYIVECDLLIIDDLGTELCNSFTNSKLFYCINERTLKRKATIISTNLTFRDLSTIYSERIVSRLTSTYTALKLFGKDIRMLKRNAKS